MYIETKRLFVRDYSKVDFADYFQYIMNEELLRQLGLEGITDEKSAKQCFNWLMENRLFLAIQRKEDGRVIGHICFHPPFESVAQDARMKEKSGASVSLAIAEEEQQKGYMTEALTAIFKENPKHWDYIDYEYEKENRSSFCLQKKLGFREFGATQFDEVELCVAVLEIGGE